MITMRLLDLRATNALRLLPGARGVGAAVLVGLTAVVAGLVEVGSADSTVAMVASEVSAVVAGIVAAEALVEGDLVEVGSAVFVAAGFDGRSTN